MNIYKITFKNREMKIFADFGRDHNRGDDWYFYEGDEKDPRSWDLVAFFKNPVAVEKIKEIKLSKQKINMEQNTNKEEEARELSRKIMALLKENKADPEIVIIAITVLLSSFLRVVYNKKGIKIVLDQMCNIILEEID